MMGTLWELHYTTHMNLYMLIMLILIRLYCDWGQHILCSHRELSQHRSQASYRYCPANLQMHLNSESMAFWVQWEWLGCECNLEVSDIGKLKGKGKNSGVEKKWRWRMTPMISGAPDGYWRRVTSSQDPKFLWLLLSNLQLSANRY